MNIMSSIEPNKYEEHRAVPSTSVYPSRWEPPWWTRRALLGTAAGAALGTYGLSLGLTAEIPARLMGRDLSCRYLSPMRSVAGSYATDSSPHQRISMCISRAPLLYNSVCMTT